MRLFLGVLAGVPAAVVPDQLKPGVRDACRYEPILQRTYKEWAALDQVRNLMRASGCRMLSSS